MDVNGSLVMTNCLVAAQPGHGIWATTGSVSLVNCTIADSGGWGVTNGGGTVTILDSILWGNALGSVPTNRLTMNNTCAQADYSSSGANNISSDPLFLGGYYLSLNGLPTQTTDSPCRDIGSVSAATRSLSARTTRTDGTADDGASGVDLGFHYASACADNLTNRTLYVDAIYGNDASNGWSTGSGALKTLTAALGRAIDHSTIYISTGKYNTALGEVFPLTIQDNNISLIATNRATTVIDVGGSAVAKRGLLSFSRGRLWIQSLSLTNAYSSSYARAADGAGLYIISGQTIITNCLIFGNRIFNSGGDTATWGHGIYVTQGALSLIDSLVDRNANANNHTRSGSGIYANGTRVTLKNSTFSNNSLDGNNVCAGGALYLNGGNAWIEGCTFATNGMSVNNGGHVGGAIYATGTAPLVLTNCTFTGNGVRTGTGSALALAGAGLRANILNCRIQNNAPAGNGGTDVDLNGAGYVLFKDTVVASGAARGIQQTGAASVLALTNCLVNNQPGHGIYVVSGTSYLQNVTSAGHTGWGLTNSGGKITVKDSIFWNNSIGGIRITSAVFSVSYTDSQESQTGTSNQNANPLFASGFYLGDGSPCLDTGSAEAAVYSLDTRSTRTAGTLDSGIVDLGYHYEANGGGGGDELSNAVLYVSVNTGNDTNNGWSWTSPLKTMTAAVGKAIDGSIVNIASGTYNTNSGESFPLVLVDNNLSFLGTNRTDTIIDGSGSNRIFEATSKGILRFEHLTVTNGYAYNKVGAGFYLSGCQTTITNCTIVRNRLNAGAEYTGDKGGGIYAYNGTLTLVDSDVAGQYNTDSYYKFGGGLYAENVVLTVRNVSFRRNSLGSSNPSYGGGVYMSGGSAVFTNCLFATNSTDVGGGLCAIAVSPLTLSNCTFVGNVATRGYNGGALYLSGGAVTAYKCDLRQNTNSTGGATVYLESSGYATFYYSTLASNSGVGFHRTGTGTLNLTNCLVFAQSNDAVRVSTGTGTVGSCTFANNLGCGITNGVGTVSVINSIAWGNTRGGITNATAATYSDSQETIAGTGNISADPRFENDLAGDFRLAGGSPCINAAFVESWMAGALDLGGRARRIGGGVDMGCYESLAIPGSIFILK
jgi:hypothetical protein